MSSSSHPAPQVDRTLLLSLYTAALALVLAGLALHKLAGKPLSAWLTSNAGLFLIAAIGLLVVALALICRAYLKRAETGSRGFGFTVAMTLITLAVTLTATEVGLRLLSRDSADAPIFAGTALLPRSWDKAVAHQRHVLDRATGTVSYLVYDAALGWTIGPNRRSADGLHFSSAEGVRAATPTAVLSGPTDKLRIAIVGDSVAFAENVRFEDSWGHLLESALGANVQVLNFAVPGYGVDQAYLRFKKDVLAWKPDVVVLGFPEHDFLRTLTVYPLINWPYWNLPFSKPRLVLDKGEFRSLNVPTIPPSKILAMHSVSELPFLEYDQGYNSTDWEHDPLDFFYTKRWLVRLFPRWPEHSRHQFGEEERLRLNSAVLRAFIRSAEDNGVAPLLVYFPSQSDIERRAKGLGTTAHRALKTLDVPVFDTTPCFIQAGSAKDFFLPGDPHYSALGNAAVAKCVRAALEPVLAGAKSRVTELDSTTTRPP